MDENESHGPEGLPGLPKITIDVEEFVQNVKEERRSVLKQTWTSLVATLVSLAVGVISNLVAAQPIYRVVRERWVILVAILVSSIAVALTATLALRQSRTSRKLTEDVIGAYRRALNASVINPNSGARTGG